MRLLPGGKKRERYSAQDSKHFKLLVCPVFVFEAEFGESHSGHQIRLGGMRNRIERGSAALLNKVARPSMRRLTTSSK